MNKKKFIMYVPGSHLSDFHKRSPWVMLPLSFSKLGFSSTLICGKSSLDNVTDLQIYTTFLRERNLIKSLFEPFFGFRKIFNEVPDMVIISPHGSYLFTIIPLIMFYKLRSKFIGKTKTKFVLKTDWSLDYTGLSKFEKLTALILLAISSYVFNAVSIETYCGIEKASKLLKLQSNKVVRIPLGFPYEINQDSMLMNEKKKRILCVARISPMKGQVVLTQAFTKILKDYPDWSLRFVGPVEDINYERLLKSIIIQSNLTEKVSFSGYISESDLNTEFKSASIFCLPSVNLENAGQVKYEAILYGLPVVTTDIPCRADAEEIGCLVARAGDIDDLSDKLIKLISNPTLGKTLVKNGRANILSYTKIAELYIRI